MGLNAKSAWQHVSLMTGILFLSGKELFSSLSFIWNYMNTLSQLLRRLVSGLRAVKTLYILVYHHTDNYIYNSWIIQSLVQRSKFTYLKSTLKCSKLIYDINFTNATISLHPTVVTSQILTFYSVDLVSKPRLS